MISKAYLMRKGGMEVSKLFQSRVKPVNSFPVGQSINSLNLVIWLEPNISKLSGSAAIALVNGTMNGASSRII